MSTLTLWFAVWLTTMGVFPFLTQHRNHDDLSPWMYALDMAVHLLGVVLLFEQWRKRRAR